MASLASVFSPLVRPGPPRCPGCAYDTAGLETPVCPECGVALDRAWRYDSPGAGSLLRRRVPVLAAAFTGVQALLGVTVVVGLCRVMAGYARFGAVTPQNVASAAIALVLSLAGAGATWLIITRRHRIAHGPIHWFWVGVGSPLGVLTLGLLAWGVGALMLPR